MRKTTKRILAASICRKRRKNRRGGSESQPSTRTVGPNEAKDWGWNWKTTSSGDETPVSNRIKNWCDGGPWNHQSRSGERRL
ncbi:hypothetical protein F8388_023049 [Cannabis sativa]|uniref:Uncharacterized protein n=1 Tax=Cannabis sativa TaxID=3483 RepID=A0A7J6HRB7_CANSA|nr:hypothetical protein F8388_023049 [Cannabis sativa]KAF4397806.1 hypothetical protein G4B88_017287 [Cannabis sativa]